MPTGSCFCGKITYEYTGEPAMKALCHCYDCKKISGGHYSHNIIVPLEGFKVTQGTPKTYSKVADSGKEITNHFCGDCGSTMYRTGDSFPGMGVVKAGTLDDHSYLEGQPGAELFAPGRVSWVEKRPDAAQMKTMQGEM